MIQHFDPIYSPAPPRFTPSSLPSTLSPPLFFFFKNRLYNIEYPGPSGFTAFHPPLLRQSLSLSGGCQCTNWGQAPHAKLLSALCWVTALSDNPHPLQNAASLMRDRCSTDLWTDDGRKERYSECSCGLYGLGT